MGPSWNLADLPVKVVAGACPTAAVAGGAAGVGEGRRWRWRLRDVDRSADAAALTATRHHADLTSDLSRKVVASDKA